MLPPSLKGNLVLYHPAEIIQLLLSTIRIYSINTLHKSGEEEEVNLKAHKSFLEHMENMQTIRS
jgi:hypothetical protein